MPKYKSFSEATPFEQKFSAVKYWLGGKKFIADSKEIVEEHAQELRAKGIDLRDGLLSADEKAELETKIDQAKQIAELQKRLAKLENDKK